MSTPSLPEIRLIVTLLADIREPASIDPRWRQLMAAHVSELTGADAGLACVSIEPLGCPHRPRSEGRPFTQGDVELVRIFHQEIGRLWEGRTEATEDRLPPRLRQTLQGLLKGKSEKEVAAQMGISPHTLHDYVKALHVKFGVRSRGELLAAAIARGFRG